MIKDNLLFSIIIISSMVIGALSLMAEPFIIGYLIYKYKTIYLFSDKITKKEDVLLKLPIIIALICYGVAFILAFLPNFFEFLR